MPTLPVTKGKNDLGPGVVDARNGVPFHKTFRRFVRRVFEANNPVSRCLMMSYRLKVALRYFVAPLCAIPPWLIHSREYGNFTYDLTDRNMCYLANTISLVTGQTVEAVTRFLEEPAKDEALKKHVSDTVRASRFSSVADVTPRFGKRLGWYAMARCLKPSVIVETGVEKGLGSVVLCSALLRNAAEGHHGRYYGTDIDRRAGYLLHGRYASVGEILYGDSLESLRTIKDNVDLFINDSDHSEAYELAEYRTIEEKLSDRAVIIGDNCHCTDSLLKFSRESDRNFLFFAEEAANHWYPTGGLGISFQSSVTRVKDRQSVALPESQLRNG